MINYYNPKNPTGFIQKLPKHYFIPKSERIKSFWYYRDGIITFSNHPKPIPYTHNPKLLPYTGLQITILYNDTIYLIQEIIDYTSYYYCPNYLENLEAHYQKHLPSTPSKYYLLENLETHDYEIHTDLTT